MTHTEECRELKCCEDYQPNTDRQRGQFPVAIACPHPFHDALRIFHNRRMPHQR